MITKEDIKTANTAFDSVPFENLIGAPLCACVNAQKQASEATIDYIQKLGFDKSEDSDDLSVVMVSFEFIHNGKPKTMRLPLLSIVPVPYLQIDTVDIKFTAEVAANSDDTFNARISNQRYEGEEQGNNSLDYKGLMDLNIRATGTNMPAGLAKILQVFQDYCFEIDDVPENEDDNLEDEEEIENEEEIKVEPENDSKIERNPSGKYYLRIIRYSITKSRLNNLIKQLWKKRPELTEESIRKAFENKGVLCTNLTLGEAEELNDMLENKSVTVKMEEMSSAYYLQITGDVSNNNISRLLVLIKGTRPELKEEDIINIIRSKGVLCSYISYEEAELLKNIIEEAGGTVKIGLVSL
ncbi:MAG: DUF2589 domain-containing protein [Paludibacteraceae bacterium]|nr:DUF2589 domain-containing protein [Paludibacteraceae bacterium]